MSGVHGGSVLREHRFKPRARWALSLPDCEVAEVARPLCEQMIRRHVVVGYPELDLVIRWSRSRRIALFEAGRFLSDEEREAALAQVSACLAMFQLTLFRLTELCPEMFSPDLLSPETALTAIARRPLNSSDY